jgi:hypothetical protein
LEKRDILLFIVLTMRLQEKEEVNFQHKEQQNIEDVLKRRNK